MEGFSAFAVHQRKDASYKENKHDRKDKVCLTGKITSQSRHCLMTGRYFSVPCVQLSDPIPAFWSSIRLFSSKVTKTQVFADLIAWLAKQRSYMSCFLRNPVDSMTKTSLPRSKLLTAVSCSSFRITSLFLDGH